MHALSASLLQWSSLPKVRAGAALCAVLLTFGALGLGFSAQRPVRVASSHEAVLPEVPLNIPLLRQLPPPQPRKGDKVAPGQVRRSVFLTAR